MNPAADSHGHTEGQDAPRISLEEAKKAFDEKSATFIDTHVKATYDAGHIPGARHIPLGDIANRLGVTESAVSHQLRLLRNTRIVRSRREGRMIFYALDDKHVLALFRQGLRHVQEDGRRGEH